MHLFLINISLKMKKKNHDIIRYRNKKSEFQLHGGLFLL